MPSPRHSVTLSNPRRSRSTPAASTGGESVAAPLASFDTVLAHSTVVRAALLAFILTFLLHVAVLGAEFVWDDLQITADDYIHDASHWPDVLTFRTLKRDIVDNNRPVMLLSLMADAALYGKRPAGYHVTNVLLHAANAALVCFIALRLMSAAPQSAGTDAPRGWLVTSAVLGSLLFAAHPVLVEPVSVVAFREDPQVTFFILVSLVIASCLERPTSRTRAALLVLTGLFAVVLAVGTKESGLAAPLALLALVASARGDKTRSGLAARWTLALGATAIVAAFMVAQSALRPAKSEVFTAAPHRIADTMAGWFAVQSRIDAFHLERIFHFGAISADYTPGSLEHISPAAGIVATIFAVAVLGWAATRGRLFLLGAVLIAVGIGAVSNIVPLYNPIADRYLYLPLAGGGLVIAGMLGAVGTTFVRRIALATILGMAILVLAAASLGRQRVFHDNVALWSDALAKTPDSYIAGNMRAWGLYHRGDYAGALASFETAVRNSGGQEPDSWAGGGLACLALGNTVGAEKAYRKAVEVSALFHRRRAVKRALLWDDDDLDRLATIARPTGLWKDD